MELKQDKQVSRDCVVMVRSNNHRKENKIVYVSHVTRAKVTTSHRISNYKRSCNEFYRLEVKHNKPLIVLCPISLNGNNNTDNKRIECFPIMDGKWWCQSFKIENEMFEDIQSSLFNVIKDISMIYKETKDLFLWHLLCLNKHQNFKYFKFMELNEDILSFIFDDYQFENFNCHLLKISVCIKNKSFVNTIKNNNDIQCLFPFYRFLSLNESNIMIKNNSNPYSSFNNTDYYTNFDKTDINHLLFDIICPYSRNGNLLVLDNSDLSSTKQFYSNSNSNLTLIVTPWYHSAFKQFSNGLKKINYKQQKYIYLMNNLWFDCCNDYLPNTIFKCNSFKIIYYDGTCTYFGTQRKKCINREIKPYNDIKIVFKKNLLIKTSVSYFALTVSIRGYKDGEKLFTQKITNDIIEIANKYRYKIKNYHYRYKSRKMLLLVYKVYGVENTEYKIIHYAVIAVLLLIVIVLFTCYFLNYLG